MWVLRAYNPEDGELVAEQELRGVDQRDLSRVLEFTPTAYGSTPLNGDAQGRLDANFAAFRESAPWEGREIFLEYDAEPVRAQSDPASRLRSRT